MRWKWVWRPGDLIGSGTISGETDLFRACLTELTNAGKNALDLGDSEFRTALEDGDEMIFRARAARDGAVTIGFGECRGRIQPEKMAGLKGENVLNGYLQLGSGPRKVLALNGWFGHSGDWGSMVDALDLEAFTYVFFDYRGYGRSRHLDGDYTFEETARDVLRLADHLGWDRFSLIGHSMGGAAIQRVLLAAPGRIDLMVAITAVPACSSRMDAQRIVMFEDAVTDVHKREFIIDFSTGRRLPKPWIAGMAQQSWTESVPKAFAGYLKEWATNDFSELVQGNATRLKVISGEFDPTLTADLMQRTWLSWYQNATLETMANSGHYPMNEVPLALAASVQAFLQQA